MSYSHSSWLTGLLQIFRSFDSVTKADVYVGLIESSWDNQKNHTLIFLPASPNVRDQEDLVVVVLLCWINSPFVYIHLIYDILTLPLFIQQEILDTGLFY